MQGVLRTWMCQNRRCGHTFDAWVDYPYCPSCGCNRCNWVPGGGHIKGEATTQADASFRDLTERYGMSDIASFREGERNMPALKAPVQHEDVGKMQFGPGFVGAPYVRDASGEVRAVCQPSAVNLNFKVKPKVGSRLARSGIPDISGFTRIEGSSK